VSTTPARVVTDGPRRGLDPVPPPGFSGAAALDGAGRLVGVAVIGSAVVAGPANASSQARLAPPEDVRKLLGDQANAPAVAAASLESAKASVVRVICVRK